MSVANAGPEPIGHRCGEEVRRGNPSFVYRNDESAGDIWAAGTRATTVSHRFGVTRHALTRSEPKSHDGGYGADSGFGADGGESDESR